jgi:hypothetical protein
MNALGTAWKHGRVRCADAVHARRFDEELVILDLAKGEYFSLDKVGALLWSGLEVGRTVEQIAQEITLEYDVTMDQALADIVALGDDLIAKGLMVHNEHGGGHDSR